MASLTARDFAVDVLSALGAPVTEPMIDFMMRWEAAEGGAWNNAERYNPLNVAAYDNNPTNSQSVMSSWQAGIAATVRVINQSNFSGLRAGILSGNPDTALQALIASPWASSHYNGGESFPASVQNYGITPLDDGQGPVDLSSISSQSTFDPNALPSAQPTLSLDALRSSAPLVAVLVTQIPEINSIFQEAVAGQWSTDKFISAVQNSHWWATHSDAARQAFLTMNTDPATWNKLVTQLESTFTNLAAELGALPTNGQLYSLAVDALTNGYDQNQAVLRQKFSAFVRPVSGLHFGGEAGSDETQLRQDMMNLGVFLPENVLDKNLQNIIAGNTDVNAIEGQLRTQAAATYPAYAKEINSGMNVSDIADPYIQQAQSLLEQGPGQVNIMNPLIKGALQFTQNGQPAPMSLTDFEDRVRQDPAWKSTTNAQNSIMQTAHQVLTDFGLTY